MSVPGPESPAPLTPLPQARRRKRSPLPVVLGVAALVGLTATIAFGNLNKSLEYFVTPSELLELKGRAAKLFSQAPPKLH